MQKEQDFQGELNRSQEDFERVLSRAQDIFMQQRKKYGDAFFEASSLTLSCLAKSRARRGKTLLKQGSNVGAVGEPIAHSLYGIINYSIMNIILQNSGNSWDRINADQLWYLYDTEISGLTKLYLAKTRDYDDEWRTIPAIALIEIVLMKFRRIEALYSKDPQTNTVPELQDIINYTIFAIILVE